MLSGLFDQIIHSADNIDVVELFKHLHPKVRNYHINSFIKLHLWIYIKTLFVLQVMLGLPVLEGTNPASCFPRTAIGYEAACYSRIWSEVWISYLSQSFVAIMYCGATYPS